MMGTSVLSMPWALEQVAPILITFPLTQMKLFLDFSLKLVKRCIL